MMNTKTKVAPLTATLITIGSLAGGAMAQTVTWADFTPLSGSPWTEQLTHNGVSVGSGSFDIVTTGGRNLGTHLAGGDLESYSPGVAGLSSANNFSRYVQTGSSGANSIATTDPTTFSFQNFSGIDWQDIVFAVGAFDHEAFVTAWNGTTQVQLTFLGEETPVWGSTLVTPNNYNAATGFIDLPTWTRGEQSQLMFLQPTAEITRFEVRNTFVSPDVGGQVFQDSWVASVGVVPEPSSILLLGLGSLSLALRRRG